jgi:hypothetical protein
VGSVPGVGVWWLVYALLCISVCGGTVGFVLVSLGVNGTGGGRIRIRTRTGLFHVVRAWPVCNHVGWYVWWYVGHARIASVRWLVCIL